MKYLEQQVIWWLSEHVFIQLKSILAPHFCPCLKSPTVHSLARENDEQDLIVVFDWKIPEARIILFLSTDKILGLFLIC